MKSQPGPVGKNQRKSIQAQFSGLNLENHQDSNQSDACALSTGSRLTSANPSPYTLPNCQKSWIPYSEDPCFSGLASWNRGRKLLIETPKSSPGYRWTILVLATITSALVAAIPSSCLPALFKEMSDDLGLSVVQIGAIWSAGSLSALLVSFFGGFLADRVGVKRIMIYLCFLVGITGALRGFSHSFFTLAATVFLNGLVRTVIPIIIIKMTGMWFRNKNLAMANGISAAGMGLGLMLGPLISATYLSPALGGWRNVMFVLGAISFLVGFLWWIFGKEPAADGLSRSTGTVSLRLAFNHLIGNKSVWLTGITIMARSATITGMIGFLPLFLRNQGWSPAKADNTLTVFFAASTIFVVPLSLLSDRIGRRKAILFPAIVITLLCIGLIPMAHGPAIWVLMFLAGMSMDGFMAIVSSMVLETRGVGPVYAGTALGLAFTIQQIGGSISPWLGNSLSGVNSSLPFIFWASISVIALVTFAFVPETGWRRQASPKTPQEQV
jgi:MFS family permease